MFLIDTSSWVSLARYYVPFDKNSILQKALIKKLKSKDIIIIDKVANECRGVAKKIVINSMPFLKDYIASTEEYIADPAFHRLLVNHFCTSSYRRLSPVEQEVKKNEYLDGADCKLVLFGMGNHEVNPIIVTEESQLENDLKCFKKLPIICADERIDIPTISLPQMLGDFDEIDFSIYSRK